MNSGCLGAITGLKIKADFKSAEAIDDSLHGCWVDTTMKESPIARFNKGGKQDKEGKYLTPYSEKYTGICKTKECGDDEASTDIDYHLEDTTQANFCSACDKGAVNLHAAYMDLSRTIHHL